MDKLSYEISRLFQAGLNLEAQLFTKIVLLNNGTRFYKSFHKQLVSAKSVLIPESNLMIQKEFCHKCNFPVWYKEFLHSVVSIPDVVLYS